MIFITKKIETKQTLQFGIRQFVIFANEQEHQYRQPQLYYYTQLTAKKWERN